jgi:hypothetical protein
VHFQPPITASSTLLTPPPKSLRQHVPYTSTVCTLRRQAIYRGWEGGSSRLLPLADLLWASQSSPDQAELTTGPSKMSRSASAQILRARLSSISNPIPPCCPLTAQSSTNLRALLQDDFFGWAVAFVFAFLFSTTVEVLHRSSGQALWAKFNHFGWL